MSIVKREIGRQKPRPRGVDSTGAAAKVKDGVIEIQLHLKVLNNLAVEAVPKKCLRAAGLRKCGSCQRGVQLAMRDAQARRSSTGALPRNASGGIVCLRQVNQVRQRIRLSCVYCESRVRNIFGI